VPVKITTKRPAYAKLTVNGKRVRDLRASRPLIEHHWLVSKDDGLKVGKNAFVLESWDRSGRRSVKRWTVKRDRTRPLTEAGPSERVVAPSGGRPSTAPRPARPARARSSTTPGAS
jgi:hypothetical protein